jgi:hypothetical protein
MYQRSSTALLLGEGHGGMAAAQTSATPQLRVLGAVRAGPVSTGQIRSLIRCVQQSAADGREGIMHPMFVKLFIETDDDDLLATEEARRRSTRRFRRIRPAMAVKSVPRDRTRVPRR